MYLLTCNDNNLKKATNALPHDKRSVVLHTLELQQFCTKTKSTCNWNATKPSGKIICIENLHNHDNCYLNFLPKKYAID